MKKKEFKLFNESCIMITNQESRWAKIYRRGDINCYVIVTNFNPSAFPDFITELDQYPSMPSIQEIKNYGKANMGVILMMSDHVYDDVAKALNKILGKQMSSIIHRGSKFNNHENKR